MIINKHTKQLEKLALEITRAAEENKKDYFIGGGLAIDFFYGKLSRNHHDIDFHPMLKDELWWVQWFTDQGYNVKNRADPQFPETWNIFNSHTKFVVDMWPFRLENGILLINNGGKYIDAKRHWEEITSVVYKNITIRIENPQRVLEQKTRHAKQSQKYRPVDVHDFKLLGKNLE